MTLVILALDALDHGMVHRFECDGYLLETSSEFKSVAHKKENPITLEAWTSIATGIQPSKHSIPGENVDSNWDNPLLDLASNFTSHLPTEWRVRLGNIVRAQTNAENTLPHTDLPHVFQGERRFYHNWPGIGPGKELSRAWEIMQGVSEGNLDRDEFERRLMAIAGEQFGWLKEMARSDVQLAGAHVHTLDAAGHAYISDEESMRRMYERIETAVVELRESLSDEDNLLVLSDHGIRTEFMGDNTSKVHSWRAFVSSTMDSVPEHALNVREWVEQHVNEVSTEDEGVSIDRQQLKDLGYI